MCQDAHCQGVGYGSQHTDHTVDGGDDCGHGHRRPVRAEGSRGSRGGVHKKLRHRIEGRGGVEKGEVIWDCHHGTGCTVASHSLTSLL